MADEFDLIERFFAPLQRSQDFLKLGIGDDAAVLEIPEGKQLVTTIDTLISGRHFPDSTDPYAIAWKSLAVNVSDLLAMGAEPAWFTLSLSLPDASEEFLRRFTEGLAAAMQQFDINLVGGDTCKGMLSITIAANGWVDAGKCIQRSTAQPGDVLCVTARLGDAALGLATLQNHLDVEQSLQQTLLKALNFPAVNSACIPLLQHFATAALDISDGLVSDLKHLIESSGVGAIIERESLPVNNWVIEHDAWNYPLYGGDDYCILLTLPEDRLEEANIMAQSLDIELHAIGRIIPQGLWLQLADQKIDLYTVSDQGWNHFA